jgi:hypothetical protein
MWARMVSGNFAENGDFHIILGIFYMPQIYDMGRLYVLTEGRCAEDLFALKNPTALAGFEPANLGTKGQHAYSKPLDECLHLLLWLINRVFYLVVGSTKINRSD